jgi:LuxR family maltose regulon positive regulatory protein
MTASLCDAITGEPGTGRRMLDRLERQNLFLVPLDEHRMWYRYHHLVADVLLSHLGEGAPTKLEEIHRHASARLEENGERSEAIRHAIAGRDFEWATELIERAIPDMRLDRQEASFRGWVKQVPDAILGASVV